MTEPSVEEALRCGRLLSPGATRLHTVGSP